MVVQLECDWCSNYPTYFFEVKKKKRAGLVGTAQFWYGCPTHRPQLEEAAVGFHGTIKALNEKEEIYGYATGSSESRDN